MRAALSFAVIGASLALGACTQQAPATDPMGPMPVVAALYDYGPLPTGQSELEMYFTTELAAALAANAASVGPERIDFDYRSWAMAADVDNIRYRVGVHSDATEAEISTAFTYPGVGGGMDLTWDMCPRADGQWRISNITATPTADEAGVGGGDPVSIRPMVGLAEIPPEECV